jgi:uncharacterized protein (TIGR02466 family)
VSQVYRKKTKNELKTDLTKTSDNCRDIFFHDSRDVELMMGSLPEKFYEPLTIRPTQDLMLIFPSWLKHEVGINESNEDRICISFNSCLK